MPVSQSWTTATRRSFILARLLRFLFFLSPAIIADVVVAEVLLGRHLFQALDAVVLAGALVERAARGGVHDAVVAREGWRAHAVRPRESEQLVHRPVLPVLGEPHVLEAAI